MPEGAESELSLAVPPEYIGGVFKQGRYGTVAEIYWKDLVPTYDVTDASQRRAWCFENMRIFSDGTLPSPEARWKAVEDHWLSDLTLAANRAKFEGSVSDAEKARAQLKKDSKETIELMRAIMAVSASARAMEQSGGSAAKYVAIITQSQEGDLDKQDSWAEYLLHNDPDKLNRVIDDPLVKHYYDQLLRDAGINVENEWHGSKTPRRFSVPDPQAVREGKLIEYLRDGAKAGGFDGYVTHLLEEDADEFRLELMDQNIDDTGRAAAAKLACDAFLVDKYTEWEYDITMERQKQIVDRIETERMEDVYGKELKLSPFKGWGGDPLRAVIEPSFLPRRIKKVYGGENEAILDLTDEAFRPSDIFGVPGERTDLSDKVLIPSMVGHLKRYARFNDALWRFVGGSRAGGIPQWTDKTMGEDLPAMVELLDQVYGDITKDRADGYPTDNFPVGKHIVGAMVARILETKALALASESLRPDWRDNLKFLFSPAEQARPFFKIEEFIWGRGRQLKDGFLVSLASGRSRIVFKDNLFGAERTITKDVWEILSTNDQDPKGRGKAKTLHLLRAAIQTIAAINKATRGR